MCKNILCLLTVLTLFGACAKTRPNGNWPAKLQSLSGFALEEEETMREILTDLNQAGGKMALLIESDNDAGAFPISITKRAPPADAPNRAGLSILTGNQCSVEISPKVFESTFTGYIKSVVWHEIGHCGGLGHTAQEGELMSPTSGPFKHYATHSIQDFFAALFSSTQLN